LRELQNVHSFRYCRDHGRCLHSVLKKVAALCQEPGSSGRSGRAFFCRSSV